jgi:small subunit ribosomal protein S6
MRHYEIVAVVHPDQQGRMSAMIDLYKKIVVDGGGTLHRFEDWGRRSLSYPIQSQHKAQYLLMNIECDGSTLEKLRETFRFSDSILRSLVIRREEAVTEPSPMMKALDSKENNKNGKGSGDGRQENNVSGDKFSKPDAQGSDSPVHSSAESQKSNQPEDSIPPEKGTKS